ncbi:hypothetical protein C1645_838597 [Glomus cerebriforme]|uniref:Uncharacterized protein n=1 Tax=Glomus cerebriforme TaxID=658196 RepID=A0A397S3D8_9GLOM|nr:hypothetical protein C1645_838597 [Glomus cerebriforme]
MGLIYKTMANHLPNNKPTKEWTSNEVIGFLESKINVYNFSQADIDKIWEKNINGRSLLRWSVEILTRIFGLEYESADSIMDLVEDQKLSDSLQSIHVSTPERKKIVPQGKELHELCKMGILRVGDELHFFKKYITYMGIVINHKFKVIEVNKNTWTPTIKENDQGTEIHTQVNSLEVLERKIMVQDLKQEIKNHLSRDRENFIKGLQEFNKKKDTGRYNSLNNALKTQGDLDAIFQVQQVDLHSERNFSIYINYTIPNTDRNIVIDIKISDYIDKYFISKKG